MNFTKVVHKPQYIDLDLDFTKQKSFEFLLTSDHHWDNPKCDRKLLKNHLDEAVKRKAGIIMNGDTFCLMQGKGDPRRNKADIRPEHNNAKYLDSIVKTAVEWYAPYRKNIIVAGYGNHETTIIKHQETDVLQRWADLMNLTYNDSNITVGGYAGFVMFRAITGKNANGRLIQSAGKRLYYFHGAGGGGVVTKGVIGTNRLASSVDADIYTTGHIHENWVHNDIVITPNVYAKRIEAREVTHISTSTYKREWNASGGFHTERGAPMKPIGSAWIKLSLFLDKLDGKQNKRMQIEVTPCLNYYQ